MAHPHRPGPHELGQNHLHDNATLRRITRLVAGDTAPLVEWAAGTGALTTHLARLDRPLEAVEVDPRSVSTLRRRVGTDVTVTRGDILRHAPPRRPYDLVCNIPFHLTTPVLRRLLALPDWRRAVLITQWEVARKRAAVGGTTLLTAQWWPWFTFTLDRKIAASAFRPRPSVDAGLLVINRRADPLVAHDQQRRYQSWVRQVFGGRGRTLAEILVRAGIARRDVRRWMGREDLDARALPRSLYAEQWAELYALRG